MLFYISKSLIFFLTLQLPHSPLILVFLCPSTNLSYPIILQLLKNSKSLDSPPHSNFSLLFKQPLPATVFVCLSGKVIHLFEDR